MCTKLCLFLIWCTVECGLTDWWTKCGMCTYRLPMAKYVVVNCVYVVSVDVHSNSPVTVGSIITFHAALLNLSHSLRNESFVYLWTNDVANHSTGFFDITATTAETTSHMSKVFSLHVPPGRYLMKVQVFRKQDVWLKAFSHLHPVAVGFHSFTLSGML